MYAKNVSQRTQRSREHIAYGSGGGAPAGASVIMLNSSCFLSAVGLGSRLSKAYLVVLNLYLFLVHIVRLLRWDLSSVLSIILGLAGRHRVGRVIEVVVFFLHGLQSSIVSCRCSRSV